MSDPAMCFVEGQFQHTIDAKGRLFIPAKLREGLGEMFFVTISGERCLTAYSEASWTGFCEKFASLPYTEARQVRPIFANAFRCEPDAQGRIVLPQKLRTYAGLDKDVTIVGVCSRVEIWDTKRWTELEEIDLDPQNLDESAARIGIF